MVTMVTYLPGERQTLASAQRTGEKGGAKMMSERRGNKEQISEESALRILCCTVPGTLPEHLSVSFSF